MSLLFFAPYLRDRNKLILRIYYGTSRAEINWDGNSVAGNVDLSEA